jgi:hypothetical protein
VARLPLYVDLSRDAPIWSRRGEPVAQPVEHLTFNQGVPGSNPGGLTNQTRGLAQSHLPRKCHWEPYGNIRPADGHRSPVGGPKYWVVSSCLEGLRLSAASKRKARPRPAVP